MTDENATSRRSRILEVAEDCFLEGGFHATNMDEISRQAGVSKKTLYKLYGSKERLFSAVLEGEGRLAFRPSVDSCVDEEALVRVVTELGHFILSERTAALHRLVITEGRLAPELAQAFFRNGPQRAIRVVSASLVAIAGRLGVRLDDPGEHARMLLGMALGEYHMRLLFNVGRRPSLRAIEKRSRRAIAIFIRGLAVRPEDAPA